MTEIAKIREQLKKTEALGISKNRENFPILEIQVVHSGIGLRKTSNPMHVQKFLLTDDEAIFLADTIKQLLKEAKW